MQTSGETAKQSTITIERRSIDVVPDSERHGTPRNQFTLWFGANMQVTAIVDGSLAVLFGANAMWAIIGLLVGNLIGGAVMALHSAQGPRLGMPQMISSRAQFGVYGAVIPLVLVILMYLGFAATGSVLSGQAINAMFGIDTPAVGILIFGVLTAVVAIIGYRFIHLLGRIATVVGIIGFAYLTIRIFTEYDASKIFADTSFSIVSFLLAVSLGAGWQLTYGPYVADYSRYLPRSTKESTTFTATLLGSVIGSMWSMTIGALIAAAAGPAFLNGQVSFLGKLSGGGAITILIYLVIVVGKLTVNTLNAYGAFMSALTSVSAFTKKVSVSKATRAAYIVIIIVIAVLIALFASDDFISKFKNFVLVLLMVFTPWSAINLIDYYKIAKERVDIPALYDPKGRYGAFNPAALTCYFIGILVQIPFLAQTLYTGPITKALGGADISWIVGLVVTAAIYYPWAKRTANPPEQMIYPDQSVDEEMATAR